MTVSCPDETVLLREALRDLVEAVEYAQQGLPEGPGFLALALDSARRLLADLPSAQVQLDIQVQLGALAYTFGEAVSWLVRGRARPGSTMVASPTHDELEDALEELELLTQHSLQLMEGES